MSRTKVVYYLFGYPVLAVYRVSRVAVCTAASAAHACAGLARPQREGAAGTGAGAEKATVPAGAAEGGAS